ncbi:triose-phosphate isomerase family protein [Lichenihabitans psoromatis]|uniref:triose-phosphate isomerase family protein n=1 Tax=Lichenihabitans psoromatis TaxID=2528642 RepID=UPI001035FBC1|nr:triose-phosphate isomerase [Lichenihabitans psoromatis]
MRCLIAGNWKMHGLAAQLAEIEAVATSVAATPPKADTLICVPATLISRAVQTASGRIPIGGEDCDAQDSGAFTVIVGHSERRRYHQETDAVVATKATAAWRAGLVAIICIGESEAQRRDGLALSTCGGQIAGSVPQDLAGPDTLAIAYEPLWAIGSGHMPAASEIVEMHDHIRQCLTDRFGEVAGNAIRIRYGGSVKLSNARAILSLPEVGGASLNAADFNAIIDAAE